MTVVFNQCLVLENHCFTTLIMYHKVFWTPSISFWQKAFEVNLSHKGTRPCPKQSLANVIKIAEAVSSIEQDPAPFGLIAGDPSETIWSWSSQITTFLPRSMVIADR